MDVVMMPLFDHRKPVGLWKMEVCVEAFHRVLCAFVCFPRWRSVWIWSNRWLTAPTRSSPPACRVSRGLKLKRNLSSHLRQVPVYLSTNNKKIDAKCDCFWFNHCFIFYVFRKNCRSQCWHSAWRREQQCWGMTLSWGIFFFKCTHVYTCTKDCLIVA